MKKYDFQKETPILFKKYQVMEKLGEGSFGEVYLGKTIYNGEFVAIKSEQKKSGKSALESEAFILEYIKGFGIPEVLSFGRTKHFRVLVEPLLGENLFDIFNKVQGKLSIEEICLIAIQVLERIEFVHSKGYIHRDIKPDNFMIGKKDKNVIYIIDFGLSTKYISSKTNNHIKFTNIGKFTGTLRFASPNALRGGQQSRKDDLISIGYMIIYFMKKVLPWQLIKARNMKERHILIYKMKKAYSPEKLCHSLPKQMTEYMNYVQNLSFDQNPSYKYLQNLFKSILKDMNKNPNTFLFSWIKQSDIPFLKKYVNPSSRRSSPQQRILKKIRQNSIDRQSRESSSNSLGNYSYESSTNTFNNPNIKVIGNANKDNFESEKSESGVSFKSKNNTNTMMVNFDKVINEKLIEVFDKIDNAIDNSINNNMNNKINNNINNKINNNMIINNNIFENSNKELDKKECQNLINFEKIKNKIKIEQNNEKKEVSELIMNIKKNKENYFAKNKNNIINQKNEINQLIKNIKKEKDLSNISPFQNKEKRNNLQENYYQNNDSNKKNVLNENILGVKGEDNNNSIEDLGTNPKKYNFINNELNEKKYNINVIQKDILNINQNYMNTGMISEKNVSKKNKVLIKNMVNKDNLYFENNNLEVNYHKNRNFNKNSNNIKNINNNNFLLQFETSDLNNNLNTHITQTEPSNKGNKTYKFNEFKNLNYDKYYNIDFNMDIDNIFSKDLNPHNTNNTNENVKRKQIKQKMNPQIPLIHKVQKINNDRMIMAQNNLKYNNINANNINNKIIENNVFKNENNRNHNFKVIKKYRKAPQNENITKSNKFSNNGYIQNNNNPNYMPMDSIEFNDFPNV